MLQFLSVDTLQALGARSAVIYLDKNNFYFEAATNKQLILPKGFPVYLEVSYKGNNELKVGIIKNTGTSVVMLAPYLVITPSSTWKTVYINLTSHIAQQTDALLFEIYFSAILGTNLNSSYIYLDNIKLIHT